MARPSGEKTRCGGQWTEAKFHSFVKNNLRRASIKWAPIQIVKKEARVSRGIYLCNSCKQEVPATVKVEDSKGNMKRVNNSIVDHIVPIIDPEVGFTTWDDCINRMYCEKDGLQVLCYKCHTEKTNKEKALAKERREKEKNGK